MMMKFAVSLLTMAACAGFSNAAQLRASAVNIPDEATVQQTTTGINGTIEGTLVLQGNVTHELIRPERVKVSTCFISSYNTALNATGYKVTAFRINQGYWHNGTNSARANSLGDSLGAFKKNKKPFVGVFGGIDWYCNLCSKTRGGLSDQLGLGTNPYIPPINDALLISVRDCMAASNYSGVEEVHVGLFPPINATMMSLSAADVHSEVEPDALKAASTMIASKSQGIEGSMLGTSVQLESDIFLYGIKAELSDIDDGVVATCFTSKYNLQYSSSDWAVTGFGVSMETVVNPTSPSTVYLLMDVFVTYTCTACLQVQPPDDITNHAGFESLIGSCLSSSGSSAFTALSHVTVRNMAGNSGAVATAQTSAYA